MRGRPSLHNDEQVILDAQDVFWEKGYAATSLADLKAATNMGSGSFYHAFKGGKKELFQRAIQQRREAFDDFKKELKAHERPVDLIRAFFLSIAQQDSHTHRRGCLIANTVTELGFIDTELAREANQILLDVEKMFSETIAAAQVKKHIKNETDAAVLGRYLITLWNGINVTRRLHPDGKELKALIEFQLKVLE